MRNDPDTPAQVGPRPGPCPPSRRRPSRSYIWARTGVWRPRGDLPAPYAPPPHGPQERTRVPTPPSATLKKQLAGFLLRGNRLGKTTLLGVDLPQSGIAKPTFGLQFENFAGFRGGLVKTAREVQLPPQTPSALHRKRIECYGAPGMVQSFAG